MNNYIFRYTIHRHWQIITIHVSLYGVHDQVDIKLPRIDYQDHVILKG